MAAARKDVHADVGVLFKHGPDIGRHLIIGTLWIPEDIPLDGFRAKRAPQLHRLAHGGIGLGVPFADENPQLLVLHGRHLRDVPLSGHKELGGEDIWMAVADGDVGHAALRLPRPIDTVAINCQRVNEMPQKIQRRRQPLRPGMVVQRHRAVFLHHGVWILHGDDDGRMLRLLFRRRPDRRAVSLRERSGFDGSVRTGVWNEEHHGILPLRIVSFGQIDKIRQSHARIGIREIVLFEVLYDQLSGSRRGMSRRTGGNDSSVGGPNVRRLHDGRAQIDRLSVILEAWPIALSLPCAAIFFRVMTRACEEVRASGLPFVFISKAKEDETSGGGNVCLLRTGIRMRRNDLSALHGETFRSHRGRIKLS